MLAAPLMVNLDIRNMDTAVKAILLNKELIAIDQDELGNQATTMIDANGLMVFKKELSGGRYAICVLNKQNEIVSFSFNLANALKMHGEWNAQEIFSNRKLRAVKTLTGKLTAHDCVIYVLSAMGTLTK
jgi:alpha-galactosidase